MFLISPTVWIVVAVAVSFFLKNKIWKRRLLILGCGLFLLFTNKLLSDVALKAYEVEVTPLSQLEHYDVGVILTGVVQTKLEPRDRVYFSKGADRVTHTMQLYKQKYIDRILISGGSGELIGEKIPEAQLIREFLLLAGVPDSVIIVEDQSRNTKENAVNTIALVKKQFPEARLLIVTSAFHLRRALGCFSKAGMEVDGFATDFRTGPIEFTFSNLFIPSADALDKWELLIHETVGLIVYKLTGNA